MYQPETYIILIPPEAFSSSKYPQSNWPELMGARQLDNGHAPER